MFKKTGDNVHYLERTGSHSTKGTRTGISPYAADEWMSEASIQSRRREIKDIEKEISSFYDAIKEMSPLYFEAIFSENIDMQKKLGPTVYRVLRYVKKLKKRIKELRAITPHSPKRIRTIEQIARRDEMERKHWKPKRPLTE